MKRKHFSKIKGEARDALTAQARRKESNIEERIKKKNDGLREEKRFTKKTSSVCVCVVEKTSCP